MKKFLLYLLAIMLTTNILSQSPEKISYQAVIRNNTNSLLTNAIIGIRISILQGSVNGDPVYIETHTTSTNGNGVVSIQIGSGNTISDFSSIDWSDGPYFLKTETDPTGGSTYTITGTSQFLSVPYALHATTAENLLNSTPESDPVYNSNFSFSDAKDGDVLVYSGDLKKWVNYSPINEFYIGQEKDGGIIFYLYNDSNGDQHGLIVSITENNYLSWGGGTFRNRTRTEDGFFNYNLMSDSPAKNWIETTLNINGESGWYLPAIDELNLLWNNRFLINKILRLKGYSLLSESRYWSSTEVSVGIAYYFNFNNGHADITSEGWLPTKEIKCAVRAIRAF